MKKRNIAIMVLITFLSISFIGTIVFFGGAKAKEFYIFSSIDECEQLTNRTESDAIVTLYESSEIDKDVENLTFAKFWGMHFQSSSLEYEIFAYEFEDEKVALQYFNKITGKSSSNENDNVHVSAVKGATSYRIVVVQRNNAYQLIAPIRYARQIDQLLAETFTIRVP